MKRILVFAALCLPLMFAGCKSGKSSVVLTGEDNGHAWVDLGLSVKWATCNVGAAAPEEAGKFVAWGELALQKKEFGWDNYAWCEEGSNMHLKKYNQNSFFGKTDRKTELLSDDDIACKQWGKSWRIPTRENWDELCEKCSWEWTGNGYKVTGPSKQSIFLPAAGYRNTSLVDGGVAGYYWSASLNTKQPDRAHYAGFNVNGYIDGTYSRANGLSVRPVIAE